MKRNYGIDLLRILSMLMVTVLHVLAQGGVLYAAKAGTTLYWTLWFFEMTCYCAVNCFALISGYGMSQAPQKLSRLCKLWLQTFFYIVLCVVAFLCFKPEVVGKKVILQSLLPITSGRYWYISVYFGVLILSPLLNLIIRHADKKLLGATLLASFVLFCVLPTATLQNPFKIDNGYSLIWVCLLYLAGGYAKKYDVLNKVKTSHAWALVLGSLAVTFLCKFVIESCFPNVAFLQEYRNILIVFPSPTIVLVSVGLLILCSKVSLGPVSTAAVKLVSPAVLGVYLTHTNPLVWKHLLKGSTVALASYPYLAAICLVLALSFAIFAVGILIDLLRIQLFKRLPIDNLCARLDDKLTKKP